jgi:hypothetical protein
MQNRKRSSVAACLKIMAVMLSAGVIISCAAEKYSSSLTKIKHGKFRGTEINCKNLKTEGKLVVRSTPSSRQGTERRLPQPGTSSFLVRRKPETELSLIPRESEAELSFVYRLRGQGVEPAMLYVTTDQNLPDLPEGYEITLLALHEAATVKSDDLHRPAVIEEHIITGRALPSTSEVTLAKNDNKRDRPSRMTECLFYLAALSAAMIVLGAAAKTRSVTERVTLWAARNPWKARVVTAGMNIILGTAAFVFGAGLAEKGVHFSDPSKYLWTATFLSLALSYPLTKSRFQYLPFSKAHDLAMVLSAFLMLANAGNAGIDVRPSAFGLFSPVNTDRLVTEKTRATDRLQISNAYLLNAGQSMQTPEAETEKTTKGQRFVLTVLAILGCLVLTYLLIAACCGLWCNGMGALAVFLGVAGGAFIIWLMYKMIRAIYNPEKAQDNTAYYT